MAEDLSVLIKQYALDLRRNASGGDDYPFNFAKGVADYLETLIKRAKGDCSCARSGFPDSCDNCDGYPIAQSKIPHQPEWDALHQFDADNNVEPFRTIAERIGLSYGFAEQHPLVDVIAAAIEDSYNLGERRGPHLPQKCPACRGFGYLTHFGEPVFDCVKCDGSGFLPVSSGVSDLTKNRKTK